MSRIPPAWFKPAIEYGPLLIFIAAYFFAGLMAATAAIILATTVAVAVAAAVERRVPRMPLFTAVVIAVFGGITLALNDETFIKMKPTFVQLFFAAILLGGLLFKRPLLKPLLGGSWPMDDLGWRRLTLRFAAFFVAMGALNELVWRTQTTDFWVVFKAVGLSGLTLAFVLCQVPLLRRHALASEASEPDRER
ncbi:MAG: septation protein A [Kiloniellales bacterium]|nr:septation protein A [Kiloniellales bacterium]